MRISRREDPAERQRDALGETHHPCARAPVRSPTGALVRPPPGGFPGVACRDMRRRPDTLFTPAFLALTLSDLAYFIAAGALIGVTPFFVTGPLAGGPAAVGLAVGAFSVTTLVVRPLAGRWADRHGRRPLLIGGGALFAPPVLGPPPGPHPAWVVGVCLLLGG